MDVDDTLDGRYKAKTLDEVLATAEARVSVPGQFKNAGKAQVCAEVLGFKFAHYQVTYIMNSCQLLLKPFFFAIRLTMSPRAHPRPCI